MEKSTTETNQEKNKEIYKEILSGNFENVNKLTELTDKNVAEVLIKQKGILDVNLNGLKNITVEVAEVLSKYQNWLSLDGLKNIDVKIAEALSRHRDMLSLDGLQNITVEVAEALSRHRGILYLNGLKNIDVKIAEALSKYQDRLYLNGLKNIDVKIAEALSRHRGILYLNGLQKITKEVYEILKRNPNILFKNAKIIEDDEPEETINSTQEDDIGIEPETSKTQTGVNPTPVEENKPKTPEKIIKTKKFWENGNKRIEFLQDGTEKRYWEDGTLELTILPDGKRIKPQTQQENEIQPKEHTTHENIEQEGITKKQKYILDQINETNVKLIFNKEKKDLTDEEIKKFLGDSDNVSFTEIEKTDVKSIRKNRIVYYSNNGFILLIDNPRKVDSPNGDSIDFNDEKAKFLLISPAYKEIEDGLDYKNGVDLLREYAEEYQEVLNSDFDKIDHTGKVETDQQPVTSENQIRKEGDKVLAEKTDNQNIPVFTQSDIEDILKKLQTGPVGEESIESTPVVEKPTGEIQQINQQPNKKERIDDELERLIQQRDVLAKRIKERLALIESLERQIEELPDEFSASFVEEKVNDLLKSSEYIKEVKEKLKVKIIDNKIILTTVVSAKDGLFFVKRVDIEVKLINKSSEKNRIIGVENYKIKASGFQDKVEKIITSSLEKVPGLLKDYIEKETGKKVKEFWVEDNEIKVTYII